MCDTVEFSSQDQDGGGGKNKNSAFIDVLISEVKKRPFLWDKKHEHYGNRRKVNRSWQDIAATLKKRPDEVKAKWRNLKDSFYRLEKRIDVPPENDGKPVASYYTGQWIHFEKLIFLRDTRYNRTHHEDYIDAGVPEICIEDIKGEFDMSEHSDDTEDGSVTKNGDAEKIFAEPITALQSVLIGARITQTEQSAPESTKRVLLDGNVEQIGRKRRILDLGPPDAVIDEDLLFVKSLVPFLRKLNPIRKLIVRNEMQNLLIKEMLCDHCRSFGPQPNCNKCS